MPMVEVDQKRLDEKLRLEFNFNSNHLEGNTLTYQETKELLIKDITGIKEHTFRELDEMKAHDVALLMVKDWSVESESRPLTEQSIKNLNKVILIKPFWKDAITPEGQHTKRQIQVGDYKSFPNSVQLENGELFEYATPSDTPILMGELMDWYRNQISINELPTIAIAALFHYKLVKIHPFDDGNGRLARLLMNYILFCYKLPPVVIKSADKKNYLRALQKADAGDLEAFVEYIAEQFIWSLELSIQAALGEKLEEADDLDKQIELLKRKVKAGKILEKERSDEVMLEFVFPELNFFFHSLNAKLQNVKSMFVKCSISKEHEYEGGFGNTISTSVFETWESFIDQVSKGDEYCFNFNRDEGDTYDRVDYWLNLSGLLNLIVNNNFSFPFRLRASQFTYSIEFDEIGQLSLGYGQPSNQNRLADFSDLVRRHIQRTILDTV